MQHAAGALHPATIVYVPVTRTLNVLRTNALRFATMPSVPHWESPNGDLEQGAIDSHPTVYSEVPGDPKQGTIDSHPTVYSDVPGDRKQGTIDSHQAVDSEAPGINHAPICITGLVCL